MKILKGYLLSLPSQMESHPSQPPPHPEREILGKKIDKEAETFDNEILEVSNQRIFTIALINFTEIN
jgi:hypothetical protein